MTQPVIDEFKTHRRDSALGGGTQTYTVALVGCGGNGSRMLTHLAQIDAGLKALGRGQLHVTAYDPDRVSLANVGRQLFYTADIGQYKATILTHRINQCFGLTWRSQPWSYTGQVDSASMPGTGHTVERPFDILITCVDTTAARRDIMAAIRQQPPHMWPNYWLDLGNGGDTGQVILGTPGPTAEFGARIAGVEAMDAQPPLPTVMALFPWEFGADVVDEDTPSCSLAQALGRQHLMINPLLATLGAELLWQLLSVGTLTRHGYFVSLADGVVNPVSVAGSLTQMGWTCWADFDALSDERKREVISLAASEVGALGRYDLIERTMEDVERRGALAIAGGGE
jgi:PRTRC genetic system ThiF family protein